MVQFSLTKYRWGNVQPSAALFWYGFVSQRLVSPSEVMFRQSIVRCSAGIVERSNVWLRDGTVKC